jgi:hypothetical protein
LTILQAVPYLKGVFLYEDQKTQYQSLTFQSLRSGYLRRQLKSRKQGLGTVAEIHRDTVTAKEVRCANWLCNT